MEEITSQAAGVECNPARFMSDFYQTVDHSHACSFRRCLATAVITGIHDPKATALIFVLERMVVMGAELESRRPGHHGRVRFQYQGFGVHERSGFDTLSAVAVVYDHGRFSGYAERSVCPVTSSFGLGVPHLCCRHIQTQEGIIKIFW